MPRGTRIAVVSLLGGLLVQSPAADAQWITLGRKALGKIKEMTQTEKTADPGYSVATVLVEGEPAKVYEAALKTIQASPKLRLTKQSPDTHVLEFADGKAVVGLQIVQVGERLVQLVIASATSPGQPDETSAVAGAALRICKELGAQCSLVK